MTTRRPWATLGDESGRGRPMAVSLRDAWEDVRVGEIFKGGWRFTDQFLWIESRANALERRGTDEALS